MKTKVAIYARCAQESERYISAQIEMCRKRVMTCGDWEIVGVFSDDGVSGSNLSRSGWQSVERLIDNKNVDVIIALDQSRIVRNCEIMKQLESRLSSAGIRLIFIRNG